MKLSNQIIRLSSDLEVVLRRAAEKIETYNGDALDDQTLIDAAISARFAAGEVSESSDISDVIDTLESIEEPSE